MIHAIVVILSACVFEVSKFRFHVEFSFKWSLLFALDWHSSRLAVIYIENTHDTDVL